MNRRPLHSLLRQAAHDFGWRDLAIAIGLSILFLLFGNGGGYLLAPLTQGAPNPVFDPNKTYAKTIVVEILGKTLPLVFAIRVAELAIADGAPPWRTYLGALLGTLAVALALRKIMWLLPIGKLNLASEHAGRDAWMVLKLGTQAGILVLIYALWRASQRTTEQMRESEARRARDAQRLRSAELLALQARVDPQLLFDALGRVGALQRADPGAADTLLTDLIGLLRAILPRIGGSGSTVEREFTVVQAWLRTAGALSDAADRAVDVDVVCHPSARQASLAPMLALPLLRAVLDDATCRRLAWRLDAQAERGCLWISLRARDQASDDIGAALADVDLGSLRERLALLHGDGARLSVVQAQVQLTLELPLSFETGADQAFESRTAPGAA